MMFNPGIVALSASRGFNTFYDLFHANYQFQNTGAAIIFEDASFLMMKLRQSEYFKNSWRLSVQ
jgi:hypothetical protein